MKNHKFTWVDGLVLALILLLIAGTAVKFLVLDPGEQQAETVSFSYEVLVSGVRQYTADALQEGDPVYDTEGKGMVGTIAAIRTEGAQSQVTYPDGTVRLVPVEDRYDLYLTIEAQGTPKGGTYQVGTYTLYGNRTPSLFTKYSSFSGRILSLQEANP